MQQLDFLPLNVMKFEDKHGYKDEMASHIEAYFIDPNCDRLRKHKLTSETYPMFCQAYQLKKLKTLRGKKKDNSH